MTQKKDMIPRGSGGGEVPRTTSGAKRTSPRRQIPVKRHNKRSTDAMHQSHSRKLETDEEEDGSPMQVPHASYRQDEKQHPSTRASCSATTLPLDTDTGRDRTKSSQPSNARNRSCARRAQVPVIDSNSSGKVAPRTTNRAKKLTSSRVVDQFPVKLHKLLSTADAAGVSSIASWLPARCDNTTASAFKIYDQAKFVDEIMPQHFNQSKFKSFRRQLNIYGFERVWTGPAKGGYCHPLFVQDKPHLCSDMKRVKVKGPGGRTSSGTSSNFSTFPMLPSTRRFIRTENFSLQSPSFEGHGKCKVGAATGIFLGSALPETQQRAAALASSVRQLPALSALASLSSSSSPFLPMPETLETPILADCPGYQLDALRSAISSSTPLSHASTLPLIARISSMPGTTKGSATTFADTGDGNDTMPPRNKKGQSAPTSNSTSFSPEVDHNFPSSSLVQNDTGCTWFEAHKADLLEHAQQIVQKMSFKPLADARSAADQRRKTSKDPK